MEEFLEQLVFKIEVYEGPLDLLLSLIAKHKMDIKDIKISLIFEQYMAYVETLQQMDMEVAGEFITMASELMLIKSKMLLPKQEKDPREELVRVLMEYKSAKDAAKWLSEQEKNYAGRFEKDTDEIKPDKAILDPMDIHILSKALERMLLRMGEHREEKKDDPIERIHPIIKKQIVPVQSRSFPFFDSCIVEERRILKSFLRMRKAARRSLRFSTLRWSFSKPVASR